MNTESNQSTQKQQDMVLSALRVVLRPLIRFLLKHGINYTMLLEELKRIFVSVANDEFQIDGRPQTDSRITLLTGVHRKDVHRIRNEVTQVPVSSAKASLGAQLISIWIANPEYLNDEGEPIPLPRLASVGGDISFESLVASVSKDFRARPVLDEWLRLGIATLDADDRVCLNTDAFVPNQGLEEKLYFFQLNIHDHMAATVNNLDDTSVPMLERCVYYDGLTQESVDALHKYARQYGMNALKSLNRKASELRQAQAAEQTADQRINFGVYFFHSPESIQSQNNQDQKTSDDAE